MPHRWPDPDAAADLAACRALIRQGSRTFYNASLLLPRRVRDPAYAVYAFCRLADDAVDDAPGRPGAAAALDRLRDRLAGAYAGRPLDLPADRAFARVVADFAMPQTLPEALLEGFAWDVQGRAYDDLSQVLAYAARVAGSVGAMMAVLMGVRGAGALARATDLGVAMQLTNIARDVGEDARAGRLYLPGDWMRQVGLDPDRWLADPAFTPELAEVVRRLLAVADDLYRRSGAGVGRLPAACRPSIHAARFLYAEIGRQVERRGLDSVSGRAVVPAGRKLLGVGRALLAAARIEPGLLDPPLTETSFLVDAVTSAPVPRLPVHEGALVRVIDLFARLERLDREGRGPGMRRGAPIAQQEAG